MSLDVSVLVGGGAVMVDSSSRAPLGCMANDGPDGGAGLGAHVVVGGSSPVEPVSDLSDSGGEDDVLREVSLTLTPG